MHCLQRYRQQRTDDHAKSPILFRLVSTELLEGDFTLVPNTKHKKDKKVAAVGCHCVEGKVVQVVLHVL